MKLIYNRKGSMKVRLITIWNIQMFRYLPKFVTQR